MGEELKDRRGRFVCQNCGSNIARVLTFRRSTETDYRIDYEDGRAAVRKSADGPETYCQSEYLCFDCRYTDVQPDEADEPADFSATEAVEAVAWGAQAAGDADAAPWEAAEEEPALIGSGKMPARGLVWGG